MIISNLLDDALYKQVFHDQHSLIVYVIVMVCPSLNLKSEWKEKMI